MTEDGTLSIVRRGTRYQVRYASNNPDHRDHHPRVCPDEAHCTHCYTNEGWRRPRSRRHALTCRKVVWRCSSLRSRRSSCRPAFALLPDRGSTHKSRET